MRRPLRPDGDVPARQLGLVERTGRRTSSGMSRSLFWASGGDRRIVTADTCLVFRFPRNISQGGPPSQARGAAVITPDCVGVGRDRRGETAELGRGGLADAGETAWAGTVPQSATLPRTLSSKAAGAKRGSRSDTPKTRCGASGHSRPVFPGRVRGGGWLGPSPRVLFRQERVGSEDGHDQSVPEKILPVAVRIAGILLGWCSRTAGTVELGLEGKRLLFVGISKGAHPGLPFSNGHFLRRAAFLRRLTDNANDLRG